MRDYKSSLLHSPLSNIALPCIAPSENIVDFQWCQSMPSEWLALHTFPTQLLRLVEQ